MVLPLIWVVQAYDEEYTDSLLLVPEFKHHTDGAPLEDSESALHSAEMTSWQ